MSNMVYCVSNSLRYSVPEQCRPGSVADFPGVSGILAI